TPLVGHATFARASRGRGAVRGGRVYLWRAGETITADKLTPRILSGAEYMEFTDPVSGGEYHRGSRRVTFPDGFFTNEPMVLITGRSNVPGNLREVSYLDKSVDGFTIWIARTTKTQTWVDWVAIEVPEI